MTDYAARVGEQLRRIRRQKGLSLIDVEEASGREFKASILGAYERGERALTVDRLARLADVYHVPVGVLLPDEDAAPLTARSPVLSLSLERLRASDAPEARALSSVVRALQALRNDWAAEVVTVRASDLYTVAAALQRSVPELVRRIDELGLRKAP